MIYHVIYADDFKKDQTDKKMQMSSHYLLDDPRSFTLSYFQTPFLYTNLSALS